MSYCTISTECSCHASQAQVNWTLATWSQVTAGSEHQQNWLEKRLDFIFFPSYGLYNVGVPSCTYLDSHKPKSSPYCSKTFFLRWWTPSQMNIFCSCHRSWQKMNTSGSEHLVSQVTTHEQLVEIVQYNGLYILDRRKAVSPRNHFSILNTTYLISFW